jgi:uncharacterized protein YoxC
VEKKKYILYLLIPVSVVLFGLFIYPTLYKYDKLDQSNPVMINRLTGEVKILTEQGWKSSEDYNAANDEMKSYRDEVMARIDSLSDEVRDKVLDSISEDIQALKEEATQAAMVEIEQEQKQLEEIKKFKKGLRREKLKQAWAQLIKFLQLLLERKRGSMEGQLSILKMVWFLDGETWRATLT